MRDLNARMLDNLHDVLERNKGTKKLVVEVFDEAEKLQMDFLSRKMQIRIGKPLIAELAELENVTFKLIS